MIDKAKAEAWIQSNDPKLYALRSSSAVPSTVSDFTPVLGSGVATGGELSAALEKEKGLDPNDPDFVAKFRDNPTTGCTTVMDMARLASGYNPSHIDDASNYDKYKDYLYRTSTAPFFHLELDDSQVYHRRTEDWKVVIEQFVELFEGVSGQDKGKIVDSLKALAEAASSNETTKQSNNLFTQSVLDVNNELRVYIYNSKAEFVQSTEKGSTVRQADFDIYRVRYRFYKDLWPGYAEMIAKTHFKLTSDWIDANRPPKPSNKLACFV